MCDSQDEEVLATITEEMRDAEAGRTVPAGKVHRMLAEVRRADRQVKSGRCIKHEGHEGVAVVMRNRSRVAASEVRLRVVRMLNVPYE